ncbi:hypothetical protein MRB53_003895 [Persea americana]|uniref:Uncharacterized protein n=1 Tax=Persea americana TaxID=3435 RepID=A0ACC2MYL7_PERAE|nr:hypothetical protein MRB53_003895 [Persea americana]
MFLAGIAPRREAALPVPLITGKLLESSPRVAGVRVAVAVLVHRWSGSVSGTRTRGSRQVKKGCPFFSSPAYCCCVLTTVIREKSKKKQQREHHQSPSSQALIRGAFGFGLGLAGTYIAVYRRRRNSPLLPPPSPEKKCCCAAVPMERQYNLKEEWRWTEEDVFSI